MCIFSFDPRRFAEADPIKVSGTQIFARGLADGRQVLVYSMRYSSLVDMAMVLPLPTPAAPSEDAVGFIDLSEYEAFFDDMAKGFDQTSSVLTLSIGDSPTPLRVLEIHDIGSFEASFVPTASDFTRLDARFRLPGGVLDALPIYRDYSFAVFKLKPGLKKVHPMALTFPRSDAKSLFFPTVHVHDGTVPETAQFDHTLYCQVRGDSNMRDWVVSSAWKHFHVASPDSLGRELRGSDFQSGEFPANAGEFMDIRRAQGLVQDDTVIRRKRMRGPRPNRDLVLVEQ